jgi:ribose transport system permease protein
MKTFLSRATRLQEMPIVVMTIGIFVVSAIFASGSVSGGALSTMLPLAGILMIASTGQSLVIQQRGIDLSGAAMISLAAVITSVYCHGDGSRVPMALLIAVAAGAAAGLVNGLMVVIGLIPIVATLAMYQLLYGVDKSYGKDVSHSVPKGLADFAIRKSLGIPNVLYISVLVVLVAAILTGATRVGHSFVATGVNRSAAIVVGTRTRRQLIAAYVFSSVTYAVAGVLLAGYVTTPSSTIGDTYLLAPIAVVILAGNSFGAAKISIVATGLGALFYTQLGQFTLSLGAPTSSQLYIQSVGIMALPVIRFLLGVVRRSAAHTAALQIPVSQPA